MELQLGGARAAIDHGFGLFGLPGLLEQQIAGRGAAFDGLPAAVRLRWRFGKDLDHLAEMLAAGGIHDDVLAGLDVGQGSGVEVVDFSDLGETYTNNVRLHGVDYTVGE